MTPRTLTDRLEDAFGVTKIDYDSPMDLTVGETIQRCLDAVNCESPSTSVTISEREIQQAAIKAGHCNWHYVNDECTRVEEEADEAFVEGARWAINKLILGPSSESPSSVLPTEVEIFKATEELLKMWHRRRDSCGETETSVEFRWQLEKIEKLIAGINKPTKGPLTAEVSSDKWSKAFTESTTHIYKLEVRIQELEAEVAALKNKP